MPANVRGFGDSPMDWYKSLPPVTKVHVTVCVATTLAYMLQLIHPGDLMLHWHFVKKLQVGRTHVSSVMHLVDHAAAASF
jgi:Der1-like family